jgi:hypothetical protein
MTGGQRENKSIIPYQINSILTLQNLKSINTVTFINMLLVNKARGTIDTISSLTVFLLKHKGGMS